MTERIGIWIATVSPHGLHPLWQRFRASPLSVRLARGVFWSLVGAVISRGLGVVSAIIVARLVGITAFGEFTIIQSTVGLFGTFAGLGLGITATKYVAELRETDRIRCGRVSSVFILAGGDGRRLDCRGGPHSVRSQWLATPTPWLNPSSRPCCDPVPPW